MYTFANKFNNFILSLRQKSSWFVYSCFLPLISSLIVLLFWIANLQILGLFAIVLITSFVLIVYDDLLPMVSLMFMVPMVFRDTTFAFENHNCSSTQNSKSCKSCNHFFLAVFLLFFLDFSAVFCYNISIPCSRKEEARCK